jgi:hypothetical protein
MLGKNMLKKQLFLYLIEIQYCMSILYISYLKDELCNITSL